MRKSDSSALVADIAPAPIVDIVPAPAVDKSPPSPPVSAAHKSTFTHNSVAAAIRTSQSVENFEDAVAMAQALLPFPELPDPDEVLHSIASFTATDDDVAAALEAYEQKLQEPQELDREIAEVARDTSLTDDERYDRLGRLSSRKLGYRYSRRGAAVKVLETQKASYARQLELLENQQAAFAPYALYVEALEKLAQRRAGDFRLVTSILVGEKQAASAAQSKAHMDLMRLERAGNSASSVLVDLEEEFNMHQQVAQAHTRATQGQTENIGFIVRKGRGLIPVQLDDNGDPLYPDSEEGKAFNDARKVKLDDNGDPLYRGAGPNRPRYVG